MRIKKLKYNQIRELIITFPVFVLFLLPWYITLDFPFFWDTVQLASKHAHHFLETGFGSLKLPNEMDSGHIPSFGYYIGFIWFVFGKTLVASHLAMLPFLIGIFVQAQRLIYQFITHEFRLLALILLLADPTLLAQSTLVSPDIPLTFFTLLAINSFLRKKRIFYSIALFFLVIISVRGMMICAGFFLADIFIRWKEYKTERIAYQTFIIKFVSVYLLPALTCMTFFVWHYYSSGWIGFHDSMPWADAFKTGGIRAFIRNALVLGWQFADFGRIAIWAILIFIIIHSKNNFPDSLRNILSVFLPIVIILSVPPLIFSGLHQHRYFIPVYLFASFSMSLLLSQLAWNKYTKQAIFLLLFFALLAGNRIIYHDSIAKGWDSSLAYLPYFKQQIKVLEYMEAKHIDVNETGSAFPNFERLDYIYLNGDQRKFHPYDLNKQTYILWSNVYNDFTDSELIQLNNEFKALISFYDFGVITVLYKRIGQP